MEGEQGSAPAGWYPDPLGLPQLRWWDGAQWSEFTSEPAVPAASEPEAASVGDTAVPGDAEPAFVDPLADFLNGNMFDLSAGEGGMEPVQLAVRSLIERATVEFMANLYGMPGPQACMDVDPLGDINTAGVTGAYVPAYNNLRTNNAESRADPNRWYSGRDRRSLGRY